MSHQIIFVPLKAGAYHLIDVKSAEAEELLAVQVSRDSLVEPILIEDEDHAMRLSIMPHLHEYKAAFTEAYRRLAEQGYKFSLYHDGVFVTNGMLSISDGVCYIEDAPRFLGRSADETEAIYTSIENAIEQGEDSFTYQWDGLSVETSVFSWTLEKA